jgi:hypothetical protein
MAWEQAHRQWGQLPNGVRIDLPSWRVFARVLGVYRTAATLRLRPETELELSAKEIARLAGYGKSVVEAALRWLGSEPICYVGLQVARGLGYICRERRKAKAYLQGALRTVYRTSVTALSMIGRGLVGLLPEVVVEAFPKPERRGAPRRGRGKLKPERVTVTPAVAAAQPEPPRDWAAGLAALRNIRMQL